MKHVRIKTVSIKQHPQLNEKWVQQIIADDPSILGLGDLILKDKERTQHSRGRLDLLLQEPDSAARYEVEIQLGATDETHVIRTIEYWDIERRKYPQYEHTAVLVAENVTARFLNVINLFNGFIPLIVLQMTAIETSEGISILFTKVVDAMQLGMVDEDEEVAEPADRSYWESRATPKTVSIADVILAICKKFDSSLELKYNKPYIGFTRDGTAFNFAICRPRKGSMELSIKLPRAENIDASLEQSGIELLEYSRWNSYRLKVNNSDVEKHKTLIESLLKQAYENRS